MTTSVTGIGMFDMTSWRDNNRMLEHSQFRRILGVSGNPKEMDRCIAETDTDLVLIRAGGDYKTVLTFLNLVMACGRYTSIPDYSMLTARRRICPPTKQWQKARQVD